MTISTLLEMNGSQFPFDLLDISRDDCEVIEVKKRYLQKNTVQLKKLKDKIAKLQGLTHKNLISLSRSTQQNGCIYLYYSCLTFSLKEFLYRNPTGFIKQLHRQFIELAIYLAKNDVLTSFKSDSCGVKLTEGKPVLQYYLPVNEIIITDQISMLQQSVQLFSLQSMHYLGMLVQQISNISHDNISQFQLSAIINTFPMTKTRNNSQNKNHKLNQTSQSSINLTVSSHLKKVSNNSKYLPIFTQRKEKCIKKSSPVSTVSFNTANSVISSKDMQTSNHFSDKKTMKTKIDEVRDRSWAAIKKMKQLKERRIEQVQNSILYRSQAIKQ